MGTFDTVHFLDNLLLCGEGHPLDRELQTKDLGCEMASYFVLGSRFYTSPVGPQRLSDWTILTPQDWQDGSTPPTPLTAAFSTVVQPCRFTGTIRVYSDCDQCWPIVYYHDTPRPSYADMYHSRQPWVEWELTIEDGLIVSSNADGVETRDQVKEKLVSEGWRTLSDDDPMAIRHLKTELLQTWHKPGRWCPKDWADKDLVNSRYGVR
jgi:hypothetical protein